MNKEKLYNILYQNRPLSEHDITEIKILIDQYPYFSIPYILLAKHYKDNESLKEISLRMAAIYVPNRTRLKRILNEETQIDSLENTTPQYISIDNTCLDDTTYKKNHSTSTAPTITILKGKNDEIDSGQPDLAKESTVLSSNIYSENLAKILNKQGKLEEAKEIYKKLMLKFPKKSSYFTSMIEDMG